MSSSSGLGTEKTAERRLHTQLKVYNTTQHSITQAEGTHHCKPQQNSAAELTNTERSPERIQLHERKQGMSKIQKTTASIQHLSQQKETGWRTAEENKN